MVIDVVLDLRHGEVEGGVFFRFRHDGWTGTIDSLDEIKSETNWLKDETRRRGRGRERGEEGEEGDGRLVK